MKTLAFLEFILSDYSICVCRIFNKCVYIYVCVCACKEDLYYCIYTVMCVLYNICKDGRTAHRSHIQFKRSYLTSIHISRLEAHISHAEMRSRHFCAFQALGPLGRVILDDGHFGQKAMSGQWLLVAAKLPEKSLVHSWASPSRNKLPWTSTISDTRNLPTNSSKLRPWRTVGGGDTGK